MKAKPNRIYEFRKTINMSQEQLGDAIGCNKSKVSKLENGNQELTQSWMIKIARAFSAAGLVITPSDLLPEEQLYMNAEEKEHVQYYRQLEDSQKAEFDAMIRRFKDQA